jgi:riboflavin synthase
MFTGIVEAAGTVESLDLTAEGGKLRVRVPAPMADGLTISNSIAVNGCCLTVVELRNGVFTADLSGETLRRTCFGEIRPGTRVNLEKPLHAGAELGGHFVQGHVDGVGRVAALTPEGPADAPKAWTYSVRVPPELHRYMAMKGSVALDGISLTIAGWHDGIVDIAIIPFTFEHTNIGAIRLGDPVNIECDVLAKYVERLLAARDSAPASNLTVEKLIAQGF